MKVVPNLIETAKATNTQVLSALNKAVEIIKKKKKKWKDYWLTDEGQE